MDIDKLVIELLGDSLSVSEMVDVGNSIHQQLTEADNKIWVSFTEEFPLGQKEGTWTGRLEHEVVGDEGDYPDEIRIGCWDRDEVEKLREKYDWEELSESEFEALKKEIERVNAIKQP